ncbi:hypothetical protein J6590_003657 [Homalodisca vitripennis]|nr:hypothetical protein J6590_003657 [Homalodisca vitripennis]
MLAYLGKEFEDHRCSAEEWLRIKHIELTSACVPATPWGKVPVLEIDGQQVTQNIPIVRYLGKEAGLGGKDNWEDLRIDEIVSVIDEFRVVLLTCTADRSYSAKKRIKNLLRNKIKP